MLLFVGSAHPTLPYLARHPPVPATVRRVTASLLCDLLTLLRIVLLYFTAVPAVEYFTTLLYFSYGKVYYVHREVCMMLIFLDDFTFLF